MGDDALAEMGRLMVESHRSYSACGLGSEGTDRLVGLVLESGPASGLFGAKITGGGSGGTVAVLGRADAGASVEAVAARYRAETGHPATVFTGSSPGAMAFGARAVRLGGGRAEVVG
jgi:L-arabinokinase